MRSESARRRSPSIDRSRLCEVAELLATHAPADFGFVQPLWDRPAVCAVAEEHAGVRLRPDRVWSSLSAGGLTLRWPSARKWAWKEARRGDADIRAAGRRQGADIVLLTCQKIVLQHRGAAPRPLETLNAIGPHYEHRFLAFPRRVTQRDFEAVLDGMARTGRSPTWLLVDHTVPAARSPCAHLVLFDLSRPERAYGQALITAA